ncbi:helix-turn-helix domain-containing protein [Arthrobacter sp. YAF17]|uniref:helix-turn-helix domain-containing protein n=1 Tax=Arthrobacter sp. YAF17 TaxID=3233077 RepID=UPI003F8E1B2D
MRQTQTASSLVSRVTTLTNDVRTTHIEALGLEWRIRTQTRSALSVKDLLELLADAGFAWRDLARMIGVSVPAIQKWRKGERSSGENRLKLAGLIAAMDLIASQFHIQDIGSWFEMPIIDGAPVTPIDLWSANQAVLVLEFASGHLNPEEVLDRFDPSWRETYESQFETFRGQDGQLSIRLKG